MKTKKEYLEIRICANCQHQFKEKYASLNEFCSPKCKVEFKKGSKKKNRVRG